LKVATLFLKDFISRILLATCSFKVDLFSSFNLVFSSLPATLARVISSSFAAFI
jgi:hypothetical protein